MEGNYGSVSYEITDGPAIGRILDAFKYDLERGGNIDLCFELTEVANCMENDGFVVESLGTDKAVADTYFSIESVSLIKRVNEAEEEVTVTGNAVVRITGDCDLFYLDEAGKTVFYTEMKDPPYAAYHVDFSIEYNVETRKGMMVCTNYRDCYYDPYED